MQLPKTVQIIPAILAKNSDELRKKMKLVEGHADWVHLDVMDGKFVQNTTWNEPNDLMTMRLPVKTEVHLMVERPEEVYVAWALAGASRIVWHYEATTQSETIVRDVRSRAIEAGIAINPETSVEAIFSLLNEVDMVLIMANTPGEGGQEFKEETLAKIRALRLQWPEGSIGVDIGVNADTARRVVAAGANVLVSGSSIFNASSAEEGIKNIMKAANL